MFPVLVSPHTEARQYRVDPNLSIQKKNDCSYCAVTASCCNSAIYIFNKSTNSSPEESLRL